MSDQSFSRRLRLLNAHDFKRVFDQADIKISHNALLILARRTSPDTAGRLGLIVAKKNLKLAVDRNQFKRQVRESFRLHQLQIQGVDLIVMARSGSRDLDGPALRAIIDQSWGRLFKRLAPPASTKAQPAAGGDGS